jgi:hypothetical protein
MTEMVLKVEGHLAATVTAAKTESAPHSAITPERVAIDGRPCDDRDRHCSGFGAAPVVGYRGTADRHTL